LGSLLRGDWGRIQDERLVVIYLSQLLAAVHYLHSNDIVHCDIKGDNILIDEYQGILKLCDFGWAHNLKYGRITKTCGTPNFMAPEVIQIPECGVGKSIDVWSIGCTVIEMLTGNPPFHLNEANYIIFQVGKYKRCPSLPEWISYNCKDFLERCFIINSSERASVEELLHHPFITGSNSKKPLEDVDMSQVYTNDIYDTHETPEEEKCVVKQQISEEEEICYELSTNVAMVKRHSIDKELSDTYNLNHRMQRHESTENVALSKWLRSLDIPEEEIKKFHYHDCSFDKVLMDMEWKDFDELNLTVEVQSKIWSQIQRFRNVKPQIPHNGYHNMIENGVELLCELLNVI